MAQNLKKKKGVSMENLNIDNATINAMQIDRSWI